MQFLITRYAKDGDFPDSSTDVTAAGAEAFAGLLGVPADHLVGVYPLTAAHAERVHRLTGVALDLEQYDYFLEPEADPM
ncbi:hypothetical protein ABZ464_11190 [Streptomyces sp. NPDC005820]|uniref:DUF7683 domain-containing protein n=1 Tax=Streptomyces sp. NPDC005820 TaxID=3157069 RepID=UPI0033EEB02B